MDITTFTELAQYVEENFNGEAINLGRGREVTLSIPYEDFDEDLIYEIIPNWNGKFIDEEDKVSYVGEVIVKTGLAVDTNDDDSLISFDKDLDLDEDDEDDWDEDDANRGWLNDDEY